MNQKQALSSTFDSIFFGENKSNIIRVPDYQRAFAWEKKQIDLFIGDLNKYWKSPGDYYFGHFIIETINGDWEIVDGQQRITTFVLFLMVCRHLLPSPVHQAFSLIDRFSTVGFDNEALKTIGRNLELLFELCRVSSSRNEITDGEIISCCSLVPEKFTRSQNRIALGLIQFYLAFEKGLLDRNRIVSYICVVMQANCSLHLAGSKSVAVNVFEMHNTRGIPLTTIEIVKAKLMKFVYDHGSDDREQNVAEIQINFGEIFRMEDMLAENSFRGELTLEQLLRLHLRVVDDGSKRTAAEFESPAINADVDTIVKYLDDRLRYKDHEQKTTRSLIDGVEYALSLAREFRTSVQIMGEFLPRWDQDDALVGDVLILDREISCQFFLLTARLTTPSQGEAFGRAAPNVLKLWEKLLFTRDFHDGYYHLKGPRDNFQIFFEECGQEGANMEEIVSGYLKDGFRSWDRTKDLQKIVSDYLSSNKASVLNNAFYWWKSKTIYALYKYEVNSKAQVREIMKGTISIEHILPQDWCWIRDQDEALKYMPEPEWQDFQGKISACINGIGNLLLVTPGKNTSEGNKHPADKCYKALCAGGSYEEHHQNKEEWRSSVEWTRLIHERGEKIFDFMCRTLVADPSNSQESSAGELC